MQIYRSATARISVWAASALLICTLLPAAESPDTLLEQAYELDGAPKAARNAKAAAILYQQAADLGDAHAQFRLGYLHETGDGVEQDYAKARELYEQAVQSNLPEARLRLAICHLEGWGGPPDRAEFVAELVRAAEQDHVPAQHILASIYFTGFHVPKDRAMGVHWLERAALLDDADAQHRLGRAVESKLRSLLTETNTDLARDWYQLSAEQDYLEAMRAMSRSFMRGPEADRQWELGRQWLMLADEAGDPEAPYILASYALRFPGAFEEDDDSIRALLTRSAERGNLRARDVLNVAATKSLSLAAASKHVLNTPHEDRYVQDVAAKFAETDPAANRKPQVTRVVTPFFPLSLNAMQTEGSALVGFVVEVKGRVRDVEVVSASHPLFGVNAVEAVKHWRFIPGQKNGRLMNARMNVPIKFHISSEQLQGVDKLLVTARRFALMIGGAAAEDAQDIRLAKPLGTLPRPSMSDGSKPPMDARAIVLLVLDKHGIPQRGHTLYGEPKEIGETLLEVALMHPFKPRQFKDQPVEGSVVLFMYPQKPPSEPTR